MKRILYLLLWLALSGTLFAQSVPAGNEKVIEQLFFEILDSLHVNRYFDSSGVQIQFSMMNPEKKAFCRIEIIKYFGQRKIPIFQKNIREKLVIEKIDAQVEYLEAAKEIFGFSGTIKRRVFVGFKGWLQPANANNGIVYLELHVSKTDQISKDKIPKLEQSPYSFTRGKWVSYSRWTRFLEPAIIFGSVSILIYLFYSLRS